VTRPRLLFLCQTLPYPPDGGVKIRSYHTLVALSAEYDIDALCFYRWKKGRAHTRVEESLAALRCFATVEAFPIPQEHSRMRLLADHASSVLSGRVYTDFVYRSTAFRTRLRELVSSRRYALVHLDSMDLAGYLPDLQGQVLACAHHNAESALLIDRAQYERSPVRGAYLRFQGGRMRAAEAERCPRFALNVAVSEDDARILAGHSPAARFLVVPNGVDTEYFRPSPGTPTIDIVFVGGTTWFPNKDALHFFAEQVLPLIRAQRPGVSVRWVGRATEDERRFHSERHGITMTGYVEDIRPIVQQAACYVAPLRAGGGTRLKILDAWAMGKALVSTRVGCAGLTARDGENLLIRDDPQGFARGVLDLLNDPGLRERLARGARDTVERTYAWGKVGALLLGAYQSLTRPANPARPARPTGALES
jgi:glycosyltransferase involved in cell wall biosynthesis